MALSDILRINLPYGMERNDLGQWSCFNREYQKLGRYEVMSLTDIMLSNFCFYKGLTERLIERVSWDRDNIVRNDKGEIIRFFLYNDSLKSKSTYFERLELLSAIKVDYKKNRKNLSN